MAVLGLLLVLAVAAGVFGVRVAWARSSSRPEPVPAAVTPARGTATGLPTGLLARSVPAAFAPSAAGGVGAGGAVTGAPSVAPAPGAPGATGATATGVVVVHVVGAVVRSGVVRLALGSRVLDAVTAAGGPAPGADLPQLNLARVVVDGEQIHVPRKGETLSPAGVPGAVGAGAAVGPGTAGGGVGAAGANAVPVDLNSADAATLDTLPGVGPVLAQRILDWRTEHGRFSSVDELGEVSGIGDKLLAQIGPKVRV
jgi:competence protein ComEA